MKNEICFIGAGKLASSFLPALIDAGFNILSLISRHQDSARHLAEKTGVENYSDSLALPSGTGILFLAVPDDSIKGLAIQIAARNRNLKGIVCVHFSGAMSSDELLPLKDIGALTVSMHIMQTFSSLNRISLQGAPAAIESDFPEAAETIWNIALRTGLSPFRLNKKDKGLYHLLGVFACNFIVSQMLACRMLVSKMSPGVPEADVLVRELLRGTVGNILNLGLDNSISGPLDRGDVNTISVHAEALKDDQLLLRSYVAESMILLRDLISKRPEDERLRQIESFLCSLQA